LGELHDDVRVFRNDKITVVKSRLKPQAIVILRPCTPKEAGISVEAVKQLGPTIPLLGVCLGHQSIGYAFGGQRRARAVSDAWKGFRNTSTDGKKIYLGLPNPFVATRYHSLIIERSSCPGVP